MYSLGDALGRLRKLSSEERARVLAWTQIRFDITITTNGLDALDGLGGQYL